MKKLILVLLILVSSRYAEATPNDDLFDGALDGNLEKVKSALKAGADVHVKKYGDTILTAAISFGKNIEILKFLLKKGASPEDKNQYGDNALLRSISDNQEMAKVLIDYGVNVNVKNSLDETPLMLASNIELIKSLLNKKANIEEKNYKGETALMKALSLEKVKLLVKAGADVNAVDNGGKPVLAHQLSTRVSWNSELLGDKETIEYLYNNGARWHAFASAPSGLIIRKNPDTGSEKIGIVPFKEKVEIIDVNRKDKKMIYDTISDITDSWKKIRFNGVEGWSFGGFLISDPKITDKMSACANSQIKLGDKCLPHWLIKKVDEKVGYDIAHCTSRYAIIHPDGKLILSEIDNAYQNVFSACMNLPENTRYLEIGNWSYENNSLILNFSKKCHLKDGYNATKEKNIFILLYPKVFMKMKNGNLIGTAPDGGQVFPPGCSE